MVKKIITAHIQQFATGSRCVVLEVWGQILGVGRSRPGSVQANTGDVADTGKEDPSGLNSLDADALRKGLALALDSMS